MPIFRTDGLRLISLTRVSPGPDLYEVEIEQQLWDNLEAFTGTDLFPVCRQPRVRTGTTTLIPDIVALDASGRVVIFEVKRSMERNQLAQSLEYAGWGRSTNLDEIASLYPDGPERFFGSWQEFTGTTAPIVISQEPLLYLVAAEFDDRTRSAIGFLEANHVPIEVVGVSVYEDESGARFLHIDSSYDDDLPNPEPSGATPTTGPTIYKHKGRRLHLNDLIEAELLEIGDELVWYRQVSDETFHATLTDNGHIELPDGHVYDSPSLAAQRASGLSAVPGWDAWRVPARENKDLLELRRDCYDQLEANSDSPD